MQKYFQESKLQMRGYYWTALQISYHGDSVHYEAWFVKPDKKVGIFFGLGVTMIGNLWPLQVPKLLHRKPRMLPAPKISLQAAVSLASEYIYANSINKDTLYLESVNLILPGNEVKEPYWGIMLRKAVPLSSDPSAMIAVSGDEIWIAVSMDSVVQQMGTM